MSQTYKVFKTVEVQKEEYIARLNQHIETFTKDIEQIQTNAARRIAKRQNEIEKMKERIAQVQDEK